MSTQSVAMREAELASIHEAIMERRVQRIVIVDPQAEADAPSTYWLDSILEAAGADACDVAFKIEGHDLICTIVDGDED